MMKNDKTIAYKSPKGINWKEVNNRIAIAQQALEDGWVPTIDEKKRILKERAKALAFTPIKKDYDEKLMEITTFMLAYETYAVESSYISEIFQLNEIVQVPGTPNFILGIINVRGKIISVVELKRFFDLPEKGLTELNKVIILKNKEMEFGILADSILGASAINVKNLQKTLPTLTGVREEYLLGVTSEPIIILDAEKLLSDKKMIVNDK